MKDMKKGEVSPVLRSPGGFHVVKLIDSRSRNAPTVVDQTRARHILVRVNEITSETEAKAQDRARARAYRRRREVRRPGDGQLRGRVVEQGRRLGWLNPGDTVPEFEQAMEQAEDQTRCQRRCVRRSAGTSSWSRSVERRTSRQDRRRDVARQAIRARKSDEQFAASSPGRCATRPTSSTRPTNVGPASASLQHAQRAPGCAWSWPRTRVRCATGSTGRGRGCRTDAAPRRPPPCPRIRCCPR